MKTTLLWRSIVLLALMFLNVLAWNGSTLRSMLGDPFRLVCSWDFPSIAFIVLAPHVIALLFCLWFLFITVVSLLQSYQGNLISSCFNNKALVFCSLFCVIPWANRRFIPTLLPSFLFTWTRRWVLVDYWYIFLILILLSTSLSFLYRSQYRALHAVSLGAAGALLLQEAVWSYDSVGPIDCSVIYLMMIQTYVVPVILCLLVWSIGSVLMRKPTRT